MRSAGNDDDERMRVRDDELRRSENVSYVSCTHLRILKIISYGDFPPLLRAFALMLTAICETLLLRYTSQSIS